MASRDENYFLVQICTLTIGPAFLAAGVYLCLRRIVYVFGPENSRLRPEFYTRIVSIHSILPLAFVHFNSPAKPFSLREAPPKRHL